MVATTLKATATFEIYDVTFHDEHIKTTVTSNTSVVDCWIDEILRIHQRNLHNLIVGLDTEWCFDITKKGPQPQPIAVLQLCIGHRCLIFQIHRANYLIPQSLAKFLGNSNFTFVGVGIETDAKKLKEDCELHVASTMDVSTMAATKFDDKSMKQMGLKGMARELLQKNMEKPKRIKLSRWHSKYLSAAQIEYACVDAFVSFELGMFLKKMK